MNERANRLWSVSNTLSAIAVELADSEPSPADLAALRNKAHENLDAQR